MGNELFEERVRRIETATALKEPDRVPVAPNFASVMQRLYGSSYRDIYYDHKKAGEAMLEFYRHYDMCDAHTFIGFSSGKANEIAGSEMIDWPGRPGTKVPDFSSHQVIEHEFMTPDEYPELLNDLTGFMLRKYIPRAYHNLKGFHSIAFNASVLMGTAAVAPLCTPEMLDTYQKLAEIAVEEAETAKVSAEYVRKLADMGIPNFLTGISEAPYDIIGDYFRGTMGIFEDLLYEEDNLTAACDMFANHVIEVLKPLKDADLPVKRISFPLHKAMDGFMSDEQFRKLYWKPFKKIIFALVDLGITPYIYTEGPYNSRLPYLAEVPPGKVIYHFETVDMQEACRILKGTACICGNLPVALLEFGKPEQVRDETKRLLDICAPGGGYIFDLNGTLENAKHENLDAMFDVLDTYGKY